MTLRVSSALEYSWERLLTPVGGRLVAITTTFYFLFSVVYSSMLASIPGELDVSVVNPLVAPFTIPLAPGGLLLLFTLLLVSALGLWVILPRGLALDSTDSLPQAVYSRRVGAASLSMVAAWLLGGLVTMVGFMLLIIPGIIAIISFSLTDVFVAVEDDGPVEALKNSWRAAKGNRVELFVLLLVAGVVVQLVFWLGGFISVLPVVGWPISLVLAGSAWVFQVGVTVGAYQQLTEETGKYGLSPGPDAGGDLPESDAGSDSSDPAPT